MTNLSSAHAALGAVPSLAVPTALRNQPQPHRNPTLATLYTESRTQTHELLAQTSSDQNRSNLGVDYGIPCAAPTPLPTPAVSQPAGPLMLLTLLGDYLGVMSFAPLSWACAGGCGMCNTSCTGPRGGQLLLDTQAHNAPMFLDKIPEVKHKSGSFGKG